MGRHSRHYNDLNPLEGGGSGGGSGRYKSSPRKSYNPDSEAEKVIGLGFGAPLAAAGTMALIGKADRAATKAGDEKRDQESREAAAEIKRESRDREESMTAGQKQSMQEAKDAEMQPKIRKAYKDSLNYKSGGKVSSASKRADGIAVKGKTRGRMV